MRTKLQAWSELQYEFSAPDTANAVEHRAETVAIDVALHVARVEAIEQVENAESDASLQPFSAKRNPNRARHLKVERSESRKPLASLAGRRIRVPD